MALHTFSIETLQKVRHHICVQLALPSSEQYPPGEEDRAIATGYPEPASLDALGDLFRVGGGADEEAPAPNAQGRWFLSTIDPAAAVSRLPGLSLKPRVRLVTYLQRRPGSGMGVTWALPDFLSTTVDLEAALRTVGTGSIPPHPKGALSHVMDSMTGAHTPVSFLVASLLSRELRELGRTGPNRRWSQHRLISEIPTKPIWQWRIQAPKNLFPKVQLQADHSAWVEFFSCRMVAPVSIFRHLDHYEVNSYRPKAYDQVIALLQTPAPAVEQSFSTEQSSSP